MLLSENRNTKFKKLRNMRRAYLEQKALVSQLKKDEDGAIIVLTLLLLISMLIVGGMAVDFMRFESERTKLQSVSDRAVLAAASLDQNRDAAEVITEFFETAGYGDAIVGTPFIDKTDSGATVRVDSQIDMSTFYLRLAGIDTLSAPAAATAIQGTGKVEVSLVLDISGSMGNNVTGTITNADGSQSTVTRTRMWFLQRAASQFIDDLLLPEYEDRISINLINYSQHVSVGDDLYRALRTTPDSISAIGEAGSSFSEFDPAVGYAVYEEPEKDENGDPIYYDEDGNATSVAPDPLAWADGEDVFTNPSRCVDFLNSEFNTLTFDTSRTYQQVEYFRANSWYVCPSRDVEGIVLLSQDADLLKGRINALQPTQNTSIHMGLKWGVSLLDPSMRDLLGGISAIDPAFRGSRPANYNAGDTVKYLILMTDGVNVASTRVDNNYYDTYEWRTTWRDYSMNYWRSNYSSITGRPSSTRPSTGAITNPTASAGTYNTWMAQLCNLAKPHYTIYTVTMGSENTHMTNCASQPSFAFRTSMSNNPGEPGMDDIFRSISEQITALRLSL